MEGMVAGTVEKVVDGLGFLQQGDVDG